MMNKKRTIKTIALALACTMVLPLNAFSLSDLWNKFKQNPQAQLVAGFSAATATIASLGYLAYKYWKKPAKPVAPKLPNKAPGTAAYASAVQFGFMSAPGADIKHSRENLTHTDDSTELRLKDRLVTNSPILESKRGRVLKNRDDRITQSPAKFGHNYASEKQTPITPKLEAQGGKKDMGNNPMTVLSMLKKSNDDAAKQRAAALRDIAATNASNAAINRARLELACEEKAGAYMRDLAKRLTAIEDDLHKAELTQEKRIAYISELAEIRELFFSFPEEGANFDKQYTDNFKRVSHLAGPKDAYKLLVTIGLVESSEAAREMSTHEIRQLLLKARLNKSDKSISFIPHLLKDVEARRKRLQINPEDFTWAIRQLDYIFRNDITREKYDAYIDGLPIVTIPSEHFLAISQRINAVKQLAYEKPEADYEHVSAGAMQNTTATDDYERTQRLAKAQSLNPETAATKAARQAQQILDAIKQIEFKEKAANAAQAASDRIQAARAAVSAATTSAFAAAQGAGAAAMAYMPSLSPLARKKTVEKTEESAVTQRPAPIIDRNAKQDQEVHVAAAAAAAPAYAQATADKPANHPEDALVDNKAPVVINAGASIALAPEQPAQPVVIAQSGKAGDSTASLEAAAAQVSTISDSGASLAPAMPEQGSAPAIVQVAQPMARPNGNASA